MARKSSLDSFPLREGKASWSSLKRQVITIGHHGLLCFRCRSGAAKYCNYGNEGNCVGEGELRVLGDFGDMSKSVGSHYGNGGFGRLFRVQFKLDFHFHMSKKGQKLTIT